MSARLSIALLRAAGAVAALAGVLTPACSVIARGLLA